MDRLSKEHPQRLLALLRAMASIVWRANADGAATDLRSWAAYSGRTVEECLGSGWLDDLHPDDRERTFQVWNEATRERREYRIEYRIRGADGRYRWFDVHATPILDDAGEVAEWVGACIDIHERVEAERGLQRVMDNISEAFVQIDADWTITFLNREGARINKKSAEDVLGKHMWDEWPEVPGSELQRQYDIARRERRPVRFEHRYYDPGKYDVWLEIQAVPDDDGGLGIFYLDITNRKKAEAEIVERDARFQLLADNLRAAFLLTDPEEGSVEFISSFARELWGCSPAELVADPGLLIDRVVPEDREFVRREVWNTLTGGEQRDYRIYGPDDRIVWVSHRRTLIPATEGRGARVAHVVTDITDRHLLEEQLRRTQRMEALGQLAGGVAHDFNNLLMLFYGHADRIRQQAEGESEAGRFVHEADGIEAAATRAAEITQQILTFARGTEGEVITLDVNESIQRADRLIRELLGGGIRYDAILNDGLGTVRLDSAHLDQLILNLVGNAAAAMDEGGQLHIETRRVEVDEEGATRLGVNPCPHVVLKVTDTGAGIPPEYLDRVFDPFFTTKGSGGTGLGLATCYGIASGAGGMIEVDSTVGEGTTFTVYLPEHDVPASQWIDDEDGDCRGSETILIVDDEPRLRELLAEGLEYHGYRVLTAVDPDQASEMLERTGDVDVVVTDIVMPGFSGAEFARRLGENRPELPVIGMSGFRHGASMPESRVPLPLRFIAKPFTPTGLALRIRHVLDAVGSEA